MGTQISFTIEPELLKRLEDAKTKRKKVSPFGPDSRSKYLIYLIEKALEIEEEELEQSGSVTK